MRESKIKIEDDFFLLKVHYIDIDIDIGMNIDIKKDMNRGEY